MTNIYVPIDYSSLRAVIPSGEEIIYSTLCIAKIGSVTPSHVITTKWPTHVLMTPKGFEYIEPQRKKPPLAFYDDWYNVWAITKRRIMYTRTGPYFIIKPDVNHEANTDFKARLKKFVPTIRPIVEARKKEWEADIPNKKERKKIAQKRHFVTALV